MNEEDGDWLMDPRARGGAFERELERKLESVRFDPGRHPLRLDAPGPVQARRRPSLALALVSSIALVIGGWLVVQIGSERSAGDRGGEFALVESSGHVEWEPNRELVSHAGARARLRVGTIGTLELDESSRLRLLSARADDYRVFLEAGSLTASIFAAPRVFAVGTPAGLAVDLGCVYRTTVESDGAARIEVRGGRVSFEAEGLHALVPSGAECRARPGRGIGLPHWTAAEPVLAQAVQRFDSARSDSEREDAIVALLEACGAGDSLTLFHLLERARAPERPAIVERLAVWVGWPEGIDRARLQAGDPQALRAWRDVLRVNW